MKHPLRNELRLPVINTIIGHTSKRSKTHCAFTVGNTNPHKD